MPFKKGQKGCGGRRSRADGLDIQKILLPFIPRAIEKLIKLLNSYDDPTAMRAAVQILDRVFGKPKDSVEVTGKDGGPIQAVINFGTKPKE